MDAFPCVVVPSGPIRAMWRAPTIIPAFPAPPGFVISDYDEDNPAEFDFPVARPLTIDADHVEMLHVKGHRYVIRYEPGAGCARAFAFQTQKYYEKLAADNGFNVEKSGAVGDVTETFHRPATDHDIWVYLEPAGTFNVLTVVESTERSRRLRRSSPRRCVGRCDPASRDGFRCDRAFSPGSGCSYHARLTADSPLPDLEHQPDFPTVAFVAAPAPSGAAASAAAGVVDPSGEALFTPR